MAKYTVEFLREASIWENIIAEVEANSKEEMQDKLKKGEFEAIQFSDSDYCGDNDTITDVEILEVE